MFNCSLAHHFHQISWAVDFSDVLPCVIRRCLKYKNKKRSLVYFQHFDKCNMDLPTAQPSAFLSETISVHYDANVAPQHQKYQLQEIELHYNAYKQGQPLYFDLVLLLLIAITHTKTLGFSVSLLWIELWIRHFPQTLASYTLKSTDV